MSCDTAQSRGVRTTVFKIKKTCSTGEVVVSCSLKIWPDTAKGSNSYRIAANSASFKEQLRITAAPQGTGPDILGGQISASV